jgi:hypothetical protein
LRFDHRGTEIDPAVADRVWRTRSDAPETMTSAARTCCHLIVTRTRGRLLAGLRGPETAATTAPVPPETEYLGVRFAFGTVLRTHPASSIVDGYLPLPVTGSGRIVLGGTDWEAPTYENAEQFVGRLRDAGLLAPSRLQDQKLSVRTRQRHYRAVTGLSRTAVAQIDRANAAATMLREGHDWRPVAATLGYFDQAHLAHALRRYIGRTAGELRADGGAGLSFLYKTGPGPGS